jgi:hypothetical protein
MKQLIKLCVFLCIAVITVLNGFSQGAPQGIKYQAVARDFTGEELVNHDIYVRLSIISGSTGGDVQWIENHTATTNKFGLFILTVGQGAREGGLQDEFSDIQWGDGVHFLKVEIKFREDGEYLNMGTSQFMSVPYALFAEYSASGPGGEYGDPDDNDKDPTNEIQSLSLDPEENRLLLINSDGSQKSSLPIDYQNENEIQDLMLNDNILQITRNADANPVTLTPYLDNTDNQSLFLDEDSIGISGGNKVSLEQFYDDEQTLTLESDSIRISNGNAIDISGLVNPQSYYFYAEKTSVSPIPTLSDIFLVFNEERVDIGDVYDHNNGDFEAPTTGLYSFYFIYDASSTQNVSIYIQNVLYDELVHNTDDETIRYSFMLYLTQGAKVNMVIYSGSSTEAGEATFAGFKVY